MDLCYSCKEEIKRDDLYLARPICCDVPNCSHLCCGYCHDVVVIPERLKLNGYDQMSENYKKWALNTFGNKFT